MIIVSGRLHVDPADRAGLLAASRTVIEAARLAPGCVDFHLSADPIDPTRINVFEQWASAVDVDAFRRDGPDDDRWSRVHDAHVEQHEIASTTRL